jgi:predicted ATP-grasp superfamily ATP-dependent carboligase
MNNPVLLLGLFDTAIMTARCFKGTGIKIYGMDYHDRHPGFYSRIIKTVRTPDPDENEEKWVQFVICWLEKFEYKFVLIPTSDEFVILCSKHMKALSPYCLSVIPGIDIINTIIERDRQFIAVASCGINVPFFLSENIILSNLSNEGITFPFAIKPVNVIAWKRFFNTKGFVIYNDEDLGKAQDELSHKPGLRFLVQAIIEGDNTLNYEVNSLYLPDGRLFMHTIRKIRQYPDRYGTATCIESFSNPIVEKLAEQIIRKMNLPGFTNIEFKYNPCDDQYYYIETNTRVWLQVNFSWKLGINFPLLYYRFLTSDDIIEKPEIKKHGKWVDFLPDILFFIKHRKKYSISFIRFIRSWFPVRSTRLFSLSDPIPYLRELNITGRFLKLFKR